MDREKDLRDRVAALEQQVATLKAWPQRRGIRKRSDRVLWGLPLYEIAVGPDPERGEVRGHARAIIAIGDIATGVFRTGRFCPRTRCRWRRSGGCDVPWWGFNWRSVGYRWFGNRSIGRGGVAVGVIAVGGVALGYYACGGAALGKYIVSGLQQDPEAILFFSQWIPGMDRCFNIEATRSAPPQGLALPRHRRRSAKAGVA